MTADSSVQVRHEHGWNFDDRIITYDVYHHGSLVHWRYFTVNGTEEADVYPIVH